MSRPTSYEGTFEAELAGWYDEDNLQVTDDKGREIDLEDLKAMMPYSLDGSWVTLVIHYTAEIAADDSGDQDTPDGAEDIEATLVRAEVNGQLLPKELAEQLFDLFADRIDTQVAERDL